MAARSIKDLESIWLQLDRSKWLTDNIIGVGPFGIGLNGITALVTSTIPFLGTGVFETFTLVVAGFLLLQGMRARASLGAMISVVFILFLDAAFDLLDLIPIVGWVSGAAEAIFRGPMLAAKVLQRDIEKTHWIEGSRAEAIASGAHARHYDEMRAQGKRRVVYLHD